MKFFGSLSALAIGAAFSIVPIAEEARAQSVDWHMVSVYPSGLVQLGQAGVRAAERIEAVSGGEIVLNYQEPGAIVPALEVFDAVASGAVEAGWGSAAFWAGKEPALQFFSSVPFGPRAGEYMAWFYFGGGQELYEEIYASHGIHSVVCGLLAPEASGWFREEIASLDDLRGLTMRFFGLGARVMEKMGVSTQLLAGGDVFPALELGTIDAAEFSMPAVDLNLGFYQVAKHYYFPGWHQQSTFLELMFNKQAWDGLNETQKVQIETVCGDNVRYGLAEGEYIQIAALAELQDRGVTLHQWSPEVLEALESAWFEVVEEESAQDPLFAEVWESYSGFREAYRTWGELGYLN